MKDAGIALSLKPVTWGVEPVVVHVNKVPETFEVRLMPVGRLLHCCLFFGLLERSGVGFTVTTKSVTTPLHPFAAGVIWYVTRFNIVSRINQGLIKSGCRNSIITVT